MKLILIQIEVEEWQEVHEVIVNNFNKNINYHPISPISAINPDEIAIENVPRERTQTIGRCNSCLHGFPFTSDAVMEDLGLYRNPDEFIVCLRNPLNKEYKESDDLCKYWKGLKK